MLINTHTYDTNYPILLLHDIQVINTKCTPCKLRTDAEPTQDLHSGYAGLIKSDHCIKTVEIWCLTLYLFRRLGELTLIVPCYFGHSSVNLRYKMAL